MDTTPHFPIYMDYSATNPCDERVVDAMVPWLRNHFGNPASRSHAWGWEAEAAVEKAREQVADLIGADSREIVWTSGATESNNLAIKGAAHFYKSRGKHLITVKTEHKAVLDTMRELERQGFEATYLDPEQNGLLDLEKFKAAIRPDTVLASVAKTHRVLIVEEQKPFASVGSQLAYMIQREAFDELDGPIHRLATIDAPAIYSPPVETEQLPNVARVLKAALAAVA